MFESICLPEHPCPNHYNIHVLESNLNPKKCKQASSFSAFQRLMFLKSLQNPGKAHILLQKTPRQNMARARSSLYVGGQSPTRLPTPLPHKERSAIGAFWEEYAPIPIADHRNPASSTMNYGAAIVPGVLVSNV